MIQARSQGGPRQKSLHQKFRVYLWLFFW